MTNAQHASFTYTASGIAAVALLLILWFGG
jgi:hypothetical protein